MKVSIEEIQEFLENKHTEYLIEGIDIDYINKVVKFNNTHEDNIDTSTILNPTYSKIDNIDVISIFKRKSNDYKTDGNPLVYALKGLNNWYISEQDIKLLFKKFISISTKLKNKYDTIITVPSTNPLNTRFMYKLNKTIKASTTIEDLFTKKSIADIFECGISSKISKNDYLKLEQILLKIAKEQNLFTYKLIPNKLRKYITSSCNVTNELSYQDKINNKDILILDDTISTGKSISDITKAINYTFEPKSITVITLFSKL